MSDTGIDRDERTILPDRGFGRDIGLNPSFHGGVPSTRQDNRDGVGLGSVGGWGERNDSIKTFAATPLAVYLNVAGLAGATVSSVRVAEGAGALRGVSLAVNEVPISDPFHVYLYSRNPQGTMLAHFLLMPYQPTVEIYLGDFGLSFDSLWLVVKTVGDSANVITGSIWVATVE